ncbi:centrosome-associated protein 350 isoform X2 [Sinocyclocheilus anshuiensis]|uniref:centrosome-associated protein 350 isoform X2 n=1 Tax=Sinocyclocheilus anshuiensis TaxID=1608454 RepID=UPI0007B91D64|nr:PREDICTED: centrosome-associated protein 350 isoform X2 [Sinocyclocheilus anshuiensis]
MCSRLRSEAGPPASVSSQAALVGQDNRREISHAWNCLNQTKAALRHIENRLEAAPGTGVLLDSVLDTKKASVSGGRKISRRDGHHVEESGSKSRTRSRRSPDKSSRSPLRNSTLDSNARKPSAVEFREPLVSYREASPLPVSQIHSEPEAHSLSTEVGIPQPNFALSQLVYQRDTRDMQTADLDSPRSSAVDSTSVRYLNDLSALNGVHQPDQAPQGSEVNSRTHLQAQTSQTSMTSITSSVTASLRLESLRRRQPDEKLEKLKDRIRRQREHLEETEERNNLLGYLEQPVGIGAAAHSTTVPTAKVRKVAPAPPAPIYKGFNTCETKIRTPDGKVWAEEDFQNLSREIYRDLTKQLTAESTKPKQRPAERDRVKEKKQSKPVRKVHRSSSAPDSNTKPAISTSSWRDGQKLVKMMLGPLPRLHREPRAQSSETQMRTGSGPHSSSDPRLERSRRSRTTSAERPHNHALPEEPAGPSRSTGSDRRKSPSTDLLSADIRGILDDLQLEEDSSRRPEAPRSKVHASTRVSRSASPAKTTKRADPPEHPVAKKRHYDAEAVRLYIAQKQEERKKQQAEERRAQREEEENKNKRLQELYRRQRAGATKGPVAPEGPIKKRLQETYTKLLLEQTQLREEINGGAITNIVQQPRPVYQPSGESDKENKRHDRPQSATSSSDLSLTEQFQPPFSRNGLGFAGSPWLQSDQRSPALRVSSSLVPPSGHIFSQLLELDPEPSLPNREFRTAHAAFPSTTDHKMSRIEALKATAASLSSRIESEARKIAGAGINYGCARDTGMGLLIPNDDRWAKPVSPPVRENPTDSDDLVERIEKLLAEGQSTYDQALPGVGNLHSFRERMETGNKQTLMPSGLTSRNTCKTPSPPKPVVQEVELDSSGGSISEGPLLSEGSISDEDLQELPKSRLETTGYSAHLNGDSLNPISRFQKEAEKHLPFNVSSLVQGGSNGPWEELAKGSPHSVINIFTKNMSYSKAFDERGGKSSPALHTILSGASSLDGMVYEEDFVSSRASSQSASKRSFNGLSNGHCRFSPPDEVLSGRFAYSNRAGEKSQHSPALTPLSSPHSASSSSKRASERSLLEGQRNTSSAVSDLPAESFKKSGSEKASSHSSHRSLDTDSTLGGASVHSIHSYFGSEGKKSPPSPRTTPAAGSPASSGSSRLFPGDNISIRGSTQGSGSPRTALPSSSSSSSSAARAKSNPSPHTQSPGRTEHRTAGSTELQFAPGVLQQRLSAELSYLDAVEESVRQLSDVERVRGMSLAQQETVSLAQILKSQQQRHERELYLLRMKAEQEALETQRQLEESRQKAARTHAELQESLLQSQQQALGGLHEATNKMINQQTEAAHHTAETARHIKQMTELAHSQIAGALSVPGPSITTLYDQQKQHTHGLTQQQPLPHTDSSWKSELSPERHKSPSEVETPPDSLSESFLSRRPTISGGGSSSTQLSPPRSDQKQRKTAGKDRSSSSVEDQAHTAADDSLCSDSVRSPLEEKADSASIATEYSVKFDDSMTEDDIEERSFRSLLPSEAHRRESLDRKPSPRPESDDDHSHDRSSPRASLKQDGNMPFSSGQDSFSKFTMDLVRQYMKEEEVRAQHQSSLLRLRQKALREKTKAELAWLEHQKRRLRDKGEDDKMPPLRKKQRGLILKLQQEQAEIKRLQEANKAARRERQLLLKQQEEIERMRHTTLKLKERLKSADTKLESPILGVAEESASPSVIVTDAETRSPSPISVSGSETSSIMQKLKKMRSHMDEKHCSPVHYFFSVFTAHHWASLSVCLPKLNPKFQLFIYSKLVRFLTKREQQLMQRRKHAEELLEWRQRLDAEEAEVRRMEKQALEAWEKQQQPRNRTPLQQRSWESEHSKTSGGQESPTGQEAGSEDDGSPALSVSSVHIDLSVPEQLASPSSDRPVSELHSPHPSNRPASDMIYSPEFNVTDSKQSPPEKASLSSLRHSDSSRPGTVTGTSGSSKMQVRSSSKTSEPHTSDPHSATPSETTSDQSDIESRIRALKDELRKRKSVVYQLKKEQKKRQKERLKAQEASLLKQLESYNDFIQKTKAELSKEPDSTPATKPQIKTPTSATEKPWIKPPPLQRPETSKNWKIVTESEKSDTVPTETSADKDDVAPSRLHKYFSEHDDISSDEDPPTVTPTPIMGSPEHMDILRSLHSPEYLRHQSEDAPPIKEHSARPEANDLLSEDESVVSSHKSGIMEELEYAKSEGSENDQSDQHSHPLLKLDLGLQIPSLNDMKPKFEEERLSEKDADDKPVFQDSADVGESMRFTDSSASPVVKSKDIDYPSAEKTPSAIDRSYTPDFSLSKREDSPKMKDRPSPLGDGYNDDFESSFESSFKEDNHESKPTSPSAPEPKEKSVKSPMYSSEEEIEEELSVQSGSTNGSFQTESHADLNSLGKGSKEDIRSPSKCSTSPQPQMPILPVKDELPGFCIGDRVLVSNIQPGTLRFKGQTNFANGFWAGVELDNPEGSNNGTYDGVVYFECREKHGIFASTDKISRLPEKFEASADTEDEDSSCDDQPNSKNKGSEKQLVHRNLLNKMKGEKSDLDLHPETREPLDEHEKPLDEHEKQLELNIKQLSTGQSTFIKSQHNLDFNDIDYNIIKDCDKSRHTVPNGRDRHIILKFEDTSVDNVGSLLNNLDKGTSKKQKQEEEPTAVILDLLVEDEKSRVDDLQKSTDISIEEASLDNREDLNNKRALTILADKLVENFLSDAVKQFQKIKKDKEEKLSAANQLKRDFINEDDGLRSNNFKSQSRSSSKTKTDSFRTSFDDDQEELSSPEHCNRPESPVLGTSGQEELAKRLAELELSRELFDVLGDEQDWFDEDFGLSSRKQQQKQKRQQQQDGISSSLSLSAGEQVKTPPRPELPVQMKQPEEPAIIVPHTVQEVEKLVIAATQVIWKSCKLGHGRPSLIGVSKPQPSNIFLEDSKASDLETQCQQSYKLAIFDLSWEVIQDIYAEDPKVDQPQWMKPRRLNSTYFHRVKCPNDITIVQEFVTTEVLKLCGLKKEQNQKTDWQKMIKFGRKKRDRVDHILVQELHEEESQWVNYDEDELFVKMQLADGIFDALLKDTADVLTQIQEKKSKRTL